MDKNSKNIGTVTQIIGPVLDIRFEQGHLPELNNAITIDYDSRHIVLEVAQHIGDSVVRCIAMSSTDGLPRGIEAVDTGAPISVPVGKETLGRIFNLLGECVDSPPPRPQSAGPSIAPPRNTASSRPEPRYWKPA